MSSRPKFESRMIALSTKELTNLLQLLSEETTMNCSLENLVALYHRHFSRQDNYRVGSALTLMLKLRDLLPTPAQRISALALLHELYRTDAFPTNPFCLFFAEMLQPTMEEGRGQVGVVSVERWFLAQILSPMFPRELYKKTAAMISTMEAPPPPHTDVAAIVAVLTDAQSEVGGHNRMGVSPVISDPSSASAFSPPDPSMCGQVAETLLCGPDQLTEHPFEPSFITPLPPLHPCSNEIMWLNPSESQYSIKWDHLMCATTPTQVKKLFTKACSEALTQQESSCLSSHLEDDPTLVYHIGLTPQKLPQLVEKNPTVAVDALLKLINSEQLSEYLAALVKMEMCLQSMEVINRLTKAVELPMEFLHLYIGNCIQRCKEPQDKTMQNRYARLVCVFLHSLIRNKIFSAQTLKDEYVEIQSFCLEYSKIKEAANLYKLLKSFDSGGST